jgi:drug/metabolite transporter (DMT)-like permease
VPAVPFVHWQLSTRIGLLLLASVGVMIVTAGLIFELLVYGSAAAVATGQAVSPLPAVAFAALFVPGTVGLLELGIAAVVVVGVLTALGTSFDLARGRALATVALASSGSGLLVVLTKLLTNEGAGIVEIYVPRTAGAAAVWLLLAPPRGLPLRALPQLTVRAALITLHFVLVIAAVEHGSPVTVQTLVATAPLQLLLAAFLLRGERPPVRVALAAVVAVGGVLAVLIA